MINFTKSIAIEYGRDGIRANAIAPGTIETPLVDKLTGTSEDDSGKHLEKIKMDDSAGTFR